MKPQFKHKAMSSFLMWFDNRFLVKGEAFVNVDDIKMFPHVDGRLPNTYSTYGSPYKAWVADESIVGAAIAKNAVFKDHLGNILDHADFEIDYENGRILSTVLSSSFDYVTASSVAIKELNVYPTNDTEEDLIIEAQADLLVQSWYPDGEADNKAIEPYDKVIPAAFLSIERGKNIPYALGGTDNTMYTAKAVVFTKEPFELDCVLGVFEDSVRTQVPVLEFEDMPFNAYGDLKGNFDYETLRASKETCLFMDDIESSKMTDVVRKKVAPNFYVGFLEFDMSVPRFPRD